MNELEQLYFASKRKKDSPDQIDAKSQKTSLDAQKVPRTQGFMIIGRLDGLNEVIEANRRNKYEGNKIKKDNETIVIYYARRGKLKPITNYPVKVVFRWFEKDRRRDWDNVISAQKFILDGLQKGGYLKGDGQKYVDCIEHYEAIDKDKPRIEVEIIER